MNKSGSVTLKTDGEGNITNIRCKGAAANEMFQVLAGGRPDAEADPDVKARLDAALRALAQKFAVTQNIVPLDKLSQPLVDEMHAVIRFQGGTIGRCQRVLLRLMEQIRDRDELRHHIGVGSETFDQIIRAYCTCSGADLAEAFNAIIPGSADIHVR